MEKAESGTHMAEWMKKRKKPDILACHSFSTPTHFLTVKPSIHQMHAHTKIL